MYVDPSGEIFESFFGPINWDGVGDAIARPFRETGRWIKRTVERWFGWGGSKGKAEAKPVTLASNMVSVDPSIRPGSGVRDINLSNGGGFRDALVDIGNRLLVTTTGALNAFGSNNLFGLGRAGSDSFDNTPYGLNFRVGQLAGDIASIITGAEEILGGATLVAGGIVAVPFSGGLSLSGSAVGIGLIGHGVSTAGFGIYNTGRSARGLVDYFGKPNKRTGRSFRPGKQKARDNYLKSKPKNFQRWYHRQIKRGAEKIRDLNNSEIDDYFEEWIRQGRPNGD